MAKTPVWQLPYPSLSDPADIMGVDGVDDLAARLEVLLSQLRAAGAIPGEIKMWPGGTLPVQATYGHWVWADGASYAAATYPLASGNIAAGWRTFGGAADPGGSNFRVPDLRGLSPAGLDQMPGGARANRMTRAVSIVIAGRTGEEYHTITLPELPAHQHPLIDAGHVHAIVDGTHMHFLDTFQHSYGTGGSVTNDFAGNPNNPNSAQAKATAANVSVAKAFTGVTVDVAGGGGAHENMPPTVFVPYIVKLDD